MAGSIPKEVGGVSECSGDFEDLYRAYFPKLVAGLCLITRDARAAEDAAQEAFARLYSRGGLDHVDQPEAWLYSVAKNYSTSIWRRQRRQRVKTGLDAERANARAADDVVARVWLYDAVERIPSKYRDVLMLHYIIDLPIADIACYLDVSVGAVKVRLLRARNMLAERL